jgi:hypothetical protein
LKVKWTSLRWKKLGSAIVWVSQMVPLHQFPERSCHLKKRFLSSLKFWAVSWIMIVKSSHVSVKKVYVEALNQYQLCDWLWSVHKCRIYSHEAYFFQRGRFIDFEVALVEWRGGFIIKKLSYLIDTTHTPTSIYVHYFVNYSDLDLSPIFRNDILSP